MVMAYPLAHASIVCPLAFMFGSAPAGAPAPVRDPARAARLRTSYTGERTQRRPRPDLEVAAVSDAFHVTTESSNGSQRIVATGELDIATVPMLEEAFEAALATDAASILVDLGGITFIDSTGLRLLIKMSDSCGNGRLGIRSTAIVDRLLQVTGLLDQLPLIADDSP